MHIVRLAVAVGFILDTSSNALVTSSDARSY